MHYDEVSKYIGKMVYTTYPFTELGDEPRQTTPIRTVKLISFDGNKYCKVMFGGRQLEVKAGYLYLTRREARTEQHFIKQIKDVK